MSTSKPVFIVFRATPEEEKTLEIMARREGQNRSEMLRTLLHEGAQRRSMGAVGLASILFSSTITRPDGEKVPA